MQSEQCDDGVGNSSLVLQHPYSQRRVSTPTEANFARASSITHSEDGLCPAVAYVRLVSATTTQSEAHAPMNGWNYRTRSKRVQKKPLSRKTITACAQPVGWPELANTKKGLQWMLQRNIVIRSELEDHAFR